MNRFPVTNSTSMTSTRLLLLGVFLLSLMFGSSASAGDEVTIDGVLHIQNPAEPPEGIETIDLEELWRVGGEDGDLLLGLPTGLDVDDAGRIYLLDAQLNQVHVISPEGQILGTRSREGDGPGEMRNPGDLIVWPDGSIGIVQEFPGYVIRLDNTGDPLPSLHPGGATEEGGWGVLMRGRARGEHLVLAGQMTRRGENTEQAQRQYLAAYDTDGNELAAYVEEIEERDGPRSNGEKDMIKPAMFAWELARDGRVVVPTYWEEYKLSVFNPDGTLDRIIEREYQPWRRTDVDRNRLLRLLGVPEGQPSPIELAEYEPTVAIMQGGIQVTPDGEIWVLTSRGSREIPAGVLARFDVFDGQGHFRRQVDVRCQGDPTNDRLTVLSDGRMIRHRRFVDCLVTSLGPGSLPSETRDDEDSSPAVICYKMID